MKLPITYPLVKARHPEAVKDILTKLKKGRSKERGSRPQDLTWNYTWGVLCVEAHFGELPTAEGRVQDILSRCRVGLAASKGRWYEMVPLEGEVPPEVREIYVQAEKKRAVEEARVAALTPQEREEELRKLFASLSKDPGFMVIEIGRERAT